MNDLIVELALSEDTGLATSELEGPIWLAGRAV
jgi:hypothetical protein